MSFNGCADFNLNKFKNPPGSVSEVEDNFLKLVKVYIAFPKP